MKKELYSNGKLLLTGEYVVLDGAKALALPTKFGQNLIIENNNENAIHWKSYDSDNSVWFETNLSFERIIENKIHTENSIEIKLLEILNEAFKLNPNFIEKSNGYSITTQLSFPKNWGLGTSSTLINNIAQCIFMCPS